MMEKVHPMANLLHEIMLKAPELSNVEIVRIKKFNFKISETEHKYIRGKRDMFFACPYVRGTYIWRNIRNMLGYHFFFDEKFLKLLGYKKALPTSFLIFTFSHLFHI